ncbi:MAG: ArsR/SmtB family transcription factor [Angustibacter sp.]
MPTDDNPDLPVRDIADARSMRALAHPLRLRLLEHLALRGPLTATQCADLVGESPASCSFHLRQLAKYGFVEEAEGGKGRNRPWRSVATGHRWDTGPDAPAGERAAARALTEQFRRHDAELYADYQRGRDGLPEEWQRAAIEVSLNGYLTADELSRLHEQLHELWRPYAERVVDPSRRPDDARLVHLDAVGFPRADENARENGDSRA